MRGLCLFVDKNTDLSIIKSYLPATASDLLVVTLDEKLNGADELVKMGLSFRSIDSHGPTEPEARKKTMEWVRQWANQPVLNGATLKELLIYRGISLWWFLDPRWILVGEKYLPYLPDAIRRLEQITRILSEERPGQTISLCKDTEFNTLLKLACAHFQSSVLIRAGDHHLAETARRYLRAVLALCRFAARAFLYRLQTLLWRSALGSAADASRIVFFMGDHWGSLWDRNAARLVEGETYMYEVFRTLKHKFVIAFVIDLAANEVVILRLKRKLEDPQIFYKPLEAYADWRALLRSLIGYWAIRRRWRALARSDSLRKSAVYNSIPCWELLSPRLDLFFSIGLLEALLTLETAFSLLEEENPRAVVLDGRMARPGRALIHAARRLHIPSVAIEHSFFFPDNAWDYLTAADIAEGRRNPEVACPLPDRILVYGERDKKMMTAGFFPEEIIQVTGAPRWDALPFLQDAWSKESICAAHGLDPTAPIVLFTAQSYFSIEAEEKLPQEICFATKQIPGAQLVVKLHPLEYSPTSTARWYTQLAKEVGLSRIVVQSGYNLYQLLRISDALVTVACNTAIEASLMDKPVMIVDLFERGHHEMFLNDSALLVARTADELSACLRGLLFDRQTQLKLECERGRFVEAYCFRKDGLAWQRVAHAILEVIGRPAG